MMRVLELDGTINKDLEPDIPDDELKRWYRTMVALRTLDEKGMKLQRQGRIGFHIPTTGQEAHVAAVAALEKRDWIFPAYREHGAAMYRGTQLENIVNQFFANTEDLQKGRRLPGLFGDPDVRFVNPSAPIGTQIIHAVGAAYAARYRGDDVITLVFFGEGATSSNDFHSGMTFAGVFQTPSVLICQNNQYAISLPVEKQTGAEEIVHKAKGYGIRGVQVDGNDVLAIYNAAKEAVERARSGEGPTFIESVTYRRGPHTSSDDPSRYRSEEEVQRWAERDPIERLGKYLRERNIFTEEELKEIHEEFDEKLKKLIKRAAEKDKVGIETIFSDVYAQMPWHLQEQLRSLRELKKRRG